MQRANFDDLARKLATTTSRRDAVRILGGTLAAGVLGAVLPGRVRAANGGNSACAHFCASVFGANTAAANQCTSDAAHHQGLCNQCGPAASANGLTLCGQTCVNKQTDSNNCGACGVTCPSGTTCSNGSCVCASGTTACGAGCCGECGTCFHGPNNCPTCPCTPANNSNDCVCVAVTDGTACSTGNCVGGVCKPPLAVASR